MKHKQKLITVTLENEIKKFQKFLQTQENIKFGRKAKTVSFVDATSKPKQFAKFVLNGGIK